MRSDATLSILHVDDDESLGDLVTAYLERDDELDCTVTTTTTPADALDRLRTDGADFDCIVSDYRMPETNGIEFLRAVRETHPELPFLLFSGEETGDLSHLSEAERALDRVEDLVTDLLDLARQGTIIESTDEVKLGTVAADAWANVATEGADLVVEADGTIEADRDRLLQLLENLFRNSIEHADALTVTVGVLDRGFYVADTGPGIPPAERGAVFERGYSTNDGTGLGLTIVQAIAEAHGWSITVTESAAGGARFEFDGVDRPVSA